MIIIENTDPYLGIYRNVMHRYPDNALHEQQYVEYVLGIPCRLFECENETEGWRIIFHNRRTARFICYPKTGLTDEIVMSFRIDDYSLFVNSLFFRSLMIISCIVFS